MVDSDKIRMDHKSCRVVRSGSRENVRIDEGHSPHAANAGCGLWRRSWLLSATARSVAQAETKTIARCGAGFLEEVDGYRVLHVKGEPYEMGYQQGPCSATTSARGLASCSTSRQRRSRSRSAGVKLLDPKRVITGIAVTAAEVRARAVFR